MKSARGVREVSQAVAVTLEEKVHVGVDVHKRSYHVAIWGAERGWIATWVQPADNHLLLARLGPMRQAIAHVVYEAGPTGFSLVRALRETGYTADVIAPSKIPSPPGQEAKSDRIDCRKLAMYSGKGLLHAVKVPTEQQEADRQLVRLREQLVRKKRAVKLQIRSFLLQHGIAEPEGLGHWARRAINALRCIELGAELRFCLDMLLDELQHAVDQVARVSARVKELAAAERHQGAVSNVTSVPYVGLVTAMTFRTELFAPERFRKAGEVTRICGLAPCVRQSGETRREGHLMKSGNSRLRTVLVEAAWRWIRVDDHARQCFRRLLANTGNNKKAIVAMARKLATVLWRISVSGEPYRMAAA